VIHCESCGPVGVPRDQLPVVLPEDVSFDVPGNPLDRHPTWTKVNCPSCGSAARRETDTLDTFVDSSWYFIRFASQPDNQPFDRAEAENGCRSANISAASSMRFCTCFMPVSGPGRSSEWARSRSRSRSGAYSPRGW
jgi:leucyl-tRNA synthetase